MEATTLLQKDHNTVEALFERFEAAEGGDEKLALARQIFEELDEHTRIEEQVFYPAIRRDAPDTDEIVREGLEEHAVAKQLIEELRAMDPGDGQYDAKMTVLKENVLHHVEEEEGEMFPHVRDELGADRLRALGAEMLRAKGIDPGTLPSRDELIDLTKDELYAKAQELGVEGRSDMTKDELVDAIQVHGA
jgi:hemerythrin superfamily protein